MNIGAGTGTQDCLTPKSLLQTPHLACYKQIDGKEWWWWWWWSGGDWPWQTCDVSIEGSYRLHVFLPHFQCLVSSFLVIFLLLSVPPAPTVCENCVEVDLMAVVTIIVVDICITLGLLMVVYYYSKSRKAKAMPVTRGAGAGGRPRGKTMEEIPAWGRGDVQPGPGWAASPSQVKIASIEHSTVWPHLRPLPSFPP